MTLPVLLLLAAHPADIFAIRAGMLAEREWHTKSVSAVVSIDANWFVRGEWWAVQFALGARAPVYHQGDPHVDVVTGIIGSLVLLREPQLTLGVGANLVALTGILFFGRVGVEGDAVLELAVRLFDGQKVDVDVGVRVEQAFASKLSDSCVNIMLGGGGCGGAVPSEYPFRAGVALTVDF